MSRPSFFITSVVVSVAAVALLACTEEVFEPTDQGRCTESSECPDDYSCVELRCARDIADAAAGTDIETDAGNDAGSDVSGADALGEASAGLSATCAEIAGCASTCETARCVQACAAGGDAEPRRKFADVVDCVEAACSELLGDQLSECQLRECSVLLESCFARPTGIGAELCPTVFGCVAGCNSAICADACVAAGSFEAQRTAVRLYECALPSCATERTAEGYSRCAAENCEVSANRCGI